MAAKDRDIAVVFQNYALYPHMTVADNMGFAFKIAGVDSVWSCVTQTLVTPSRRTSELIWLRTSTRNSRR